MYSRQKLVLLLIGTMCLLQKTTAQNPIFRQLYTHRYLTNPALVGNGSQEGISINRIASGTKAQWLSLDSRLVTQTLSFDAPVNANNSSWGIGAFLRNIDLCLQYPSEENEFKIWTFSAVFGNIIWR